MISERKNADSGESANIIKAYNEGIGGVDLMNRLLQSYRPGTTMTETFLFAKILNVSVGAIWRLFQRANSKVNLENSHLNYPGVDQI